MKCQLTTLLLTLILFGVGACSDSSNRTEMAASDNVSTSEAQTNSTRISLVEAAAWDFQGKTRDAFSGHRPGTIACLKGEGWVIEADEIEIRTEFCNYLSLTQESLLSIPAGSILEFALSHSDLVFQNDATAHVALSVGGVTVWEREIDIPSEGEIYLQEISLDFAIAQRDSIEVHLHNHGSNSWTIHSLDAIVSGEFDPVALCPTYDSTFAAIQATVFEQSGCANSLCHSAEAASGGLDLSTAVAYENLVDVPALGSTALLVDPRSPSRSYLFQKLSAKTQPGSFDIAGSPMPSGGPAISAGQLEAVRLWIEAGAPKQGSVGDTLGRGEDEIERLLGVCLPEPEAVNVIPLEPPEPTKGLQFEMPGHEVLAESERELCFAVYYDFRDQIPAEYMNEDRSQFYVHGGEFREDPFTHHNVLFYAGVPVEQAQDESFGQWTCAGGDMAGAQCEPTDTNSCGDIGQCRSEIQDSIACQGYGPGTGRVSAVDRVSQFSVGGGPDVDGFYETVPSYGIFYWNSHAFNLTTEDAQHNVWRNLNYADDRRFNADRITYSRHIFRGAGTAPFSKREVCEEFILDQDDALLSLSSHTHKRGERFTMAMKGSEDQPFYTSLNYDEPLQLNYSPPLQFNDSDPDSRTIVYCALYNNGVNPNGSPNLDTVTRLSRKPVRSGCNPVACVSGNVGTRCAGITDHASCDSSDGAGDGMCDACAISPGVTSDDEMFILLGSRAVNFAAQIANTPPAIDIESPASGARFKPGDSFTLSLAFSNFDLQPPEEHNATGGHDSAMHSNQDSSMTGGHVVIREGHYHVYLDTEEDGADHVTQWAPSIEYTLPTDIEPGEHYLRINLRAPDHHALGIEARVSFIVE